MASIVSSTLSLTQRQEFLEKSLSLQAEIPAAAARIRKPFTFFRSIDFLSRPINERLLKRAECVEEYITYFRKEIPVSVQQNENGSLDFCRSELTDEFTKLSQIIALIFDQKKISLYCPENWQKLSPAQWQVLASEQAQYVVQNQVVTVQDLIGLSPDKISFLIEDGCRLMQFGALTLEEIRLLPLYYLEKLPQEETYKFWQFLTDKNLYQMGFDELRDVILEQGWISVNSREFQLLALQDLYRGRNNQDLIHFVQSKGKEVYENFQSHFQRELEVLETINVLNTEGLELLDRLHKRGALFEDYYLSALEFLQDEMNLIMAGYLFALNIPNYMPSILDQLDEYVRPTVALQAAEAEKDILENGAYDSRLYIRDIAKTYVKNVVGIYLQGNCELSAHNIKHMTLTERVDFLERYMRVDIEKWIVDYHLIEADTVNNRRRALERMDGQAIVDLVIHKKLNHFKALGVPAERSDLLSEKTFAVLLKRLCERAIESMDKLKASFVGEMDSILKIRENILQLSEENFLTKPLYELNDIEKLTAYMIQTGDERLYYDLLSKLINLGKIDAQACDRYERDWRHENLLKDFANEARLSIFQVPVPILISEDGANKKKRTIGNDFLKNEHKKVKKGEQNDLRAFMAPYLDGYNLDEEF